MSKFEEAIKCPNCVYSLPKEVLADETLSLDEKMQILKQWEQDARQILTADEENMVGDSPSLLNRVMLAIESLEKNK